MVSFTYFYLGKNIFFCIRVLHFILIEYCFRFSSSATLQLINCSIFLSPRSAALTPKRLTIMTISVTFDIITINVIFNNNPGVMSSSPGHPINIDNRRDDLILPNQHFNIPLDHPNRHLPVTFPSRDSPFPSPRNDDFVMTTPSKISSRRLDRRVSRALSWSRRKTCRYHRRPLPP